jgi:hypothetical protein
VPGDIVLTLPFGKGQQWHVVLLSERLDAGDESFADRVHKSGRGDAMSSVVAQEAGDALFKLQISHVHVQVHAVDAFHFQGDVLVEDFRDRA